MPVVNTQLYRVLRPYGPPPPQSGKMTYQKLEALLQHGYGQGHFQDYKPWMRVTKKDSSPCSNVGHERLPDQHRAQHYRSLAEKTTAQVAQWLGAVDVRDQFPMWPWAHDHPGFGLDGFGRQQVRGLLDIAASAQIQHGTYVGTTIPYVATLDLLTTWKFDTESSYELLAIENKPEHIVNSPDPTHPAKRRLELGRLYCKEAGIARLVLSAENFSSTFRRNIDALRPNVGVTESTAMRATNVYREMLERLASQGYTTPPTKILETVRKRHNLGETAVGDCFRLAVWRQDVDHDISVPFRPWEPLIQGGRAYRAALRNEWFKGRPR